MKKKADQFESLYLGLAGCLPDIDMTINLFVPFEHGVVTHTYLGGMLFVLGFAVLTYLLVTPLLRKTDVSFGRLVWLGFLGLSLHFLLDMFTYHPGPCSIWLNPAMMPTECVCPGVDCISPDDRHHMYFWPLWNFPPHLNTVFPYTWVTYELRVWIEVIYTVLIAVVLLYLWIGKRENIFGVFFPTAWWSHVPIPEKEGSEVEKPRKLIHFYPEFLKKVPRTLWIYAFGLYFLIIFPYIVTLIQAIRS